jgi:hypothetical protein
MLDEDEDIFVIKEKWGKGDTVPDTQIFKLDFTKSAKYSKRKIKIKCKVSNSAWQSDASNSAGSTPALTPASTTNFGHLSPTNFGHLSPSNFGHLSPSSTVSGEKLQTQSAANSTLPATMSESEWAGEDRMESERPPLPGIDEAGSEEELGKGNIVPNTQKFKLDSTKSARYSKRKIRLTRKGSSFARQDDVPTNVGSPPVFTAAFTAASTMNIFEKARSAKTPRADEDDGAAQSGEFATPPDHNLEAKNGDEPQIKRIRNNNLPALRTSTNVGSQPALTAYPINVGHLSPSHAVSPRTLQAENAPNFTILAQDSSSAAVIATPTRTSLIEEGGFDYRELAKAATKGRKFVGTVHSDGTVETKRRWICCGRRALGAAEQRAITAVIPKQEEGIDKALTDTIRDRARRSQRNARFHR